MRGRVQVGIRTTLGVLAVLFVSYPLFWPISSVHAQELLAPEIRAAMLKRKDGLITHVETIYNDIFVLKYQNLLTMTFHWKGYYFQESQVNLTDPDDLPMLYARAISRCFSTSSRRCLYVSSSSWARSASSFAARLSAYFL